ncbi:hypothetical protein ZWY2020_033806 [Hordeum vulgare]|nr:hypothetical protein ZWY2020_033806 [Hordeum vulgare]
MTLREELIGTYPGPHLPRVAPRLVPRHPGLRRRRCGHRLLRRQRRVPPRPVQRLPARAALGVPGELSAICALLKAWPATVISPRRRRRARRSALHSGDASVLPERTNEASGRYARACVEVAAECRLRTIDVWSRMQEFPGWETAFLRDGLHLTPTGNRLLFEEVVFALRDANLSLEALPADLPLCSDINPNDVVNRA